MKQVWSAFASYVRFYLKAKKVKCKCIVNLSSADFAWSQRKVNQDRMIVATCNSDQPRWNSKLGSLVYVFSVCMCMTFVLVSREVIKNELMFH